ncbi:MAG: adenine deaminase [Tissierellia bacterium]|nr:adenine deaminase [Tissierellia bacterium]
MEKMDIVLGKEKTPLVFKNARVLNVYTKEWERTDIAVKDGQILGTGKYDGDREIDCENRYIVPGFIDTHLHLESTLVHPKYLITEAAKTGTTTFIVDPHEAANVSGTDGIQFILDETEDVMASCFIMLPSCVPCIPGEQSGAQLRAEDLAPFLSHERVLGLGEVMDCRSVFEGAEEMMEKLRLFENKPKDGHNTGLSEHELNAYRLAGIQTNHEMTTYEDAKKEISKGFYCHIREGSAARNLKDIVRGIVEDKGSTRFYTFCTDDKHIHDILEEGHISHSIRKAIGLGIPPEEAYQMASLNGAICYGLNKKGAIAPGKDADLVLLKDPKKVIIDEVYHQGKKVEGNPVIGPTPENLLQTVHLGEFTVDHLKDVDCDDIMVLIPDQLLTKRIPYEEGDHGHLNKILLAERHGKTGDIGLGWVQGYGIKNGALATSVSHDNHNIIAIGDNDLDIYQGIRHLEKTGGGYVLVEKGKIVGSLPLEIMGLMTNESYEKVNRTLSRMKEKAHQMGIPRNIEPFILPSFLALTVIPEIRISSKGMVIVK